VLQIGAAFDAMLGRASANCWAIATLTFWRRAVNLYQRCVINISSESTFYGLKIGLMAIRGELNTIG
jgi:hypothetical protein